MKVLVVHNRYLSHNIGGEDVVYRSEVAELHKILGAENVHTYDVSNDGLSKWKLVFSIWFSRRHYNAIAKLVKEQKISVVHVHNFFPLLTPSVFLAAKKSGAKVVHTLHNFRWWCVAGIFYRESVGACELCAGKKFPLSGMRFRCYRNSFVQSFLAQLAFSFYKVMNFWSAVDRFIVLSDFQREKVLSLGLPSHKIVFRPHGIPIPPQVSKAKRGYIYVGRLETAKGIEFLLEAWRDLGPEFQLTIIGEGVLTPRSPNIQFLGKQDHATTLQYIADAKFLIHPSLVYETFGLTILEAMAVGTPVIGFNIGTRPEFLRDGHGMLCAPNELRETIVKSAQHPSYDELSARVRDFAQQFRSELMVKRLISVYED